MPAGAAADVPDALTSQTKLPCDKLNLAARLSRIDRVQEHVEPGLRVRLSAHGRLDQGRTTPTMVSSRSDSMASITPRAISLFVSQREPELSMTNPRMTLRR